MVGYLITLALFVGGFIHLTRGEFTPGITMMGLSYVLAKLYRAEGLR